MPAFGNLRLFVVLVATLASAGPTLYAQESSFPFQDPTLPIDTRVDDLVGRMTLEEKASQLVNRTRAIPRLNVPEYNIWSEALHGVAGRGYATVFPQAIGLAATFDAPMLHRMAVATAREARVKYNQAARAGRAGQMMGGLTFFSPNINIFRDPRWGRGQETYGEDPFLAARLGVAFITGMQGSDLDHPVVTATAKHYAVHSGPEPLRHGFDAQASVHDIEDTYLPAFRAAVVEGKVTSVMCVYTAITGVPGCASELFLDGTLREAWQFTGFVTGDCDAVRDVETGHKYAASAAEAGAFAIKAGLDSDCTTSGLFRGEGPPDFQRYIDAAEQGLLTEAEIDVALKRMLRIRFELGLFDPLESVEAAQVPDSELDSPEHRELALQLARESIVLLKNDGLLPLAKAPARIAVVGPLADNSRVLLGNYNGYPSRSTTALEGIKKQFPKARVVFEPGTTFLRPDVPVPTSALTTETGAAGLTAEVFDNPDLAGTPVETRVDKQVMVGRRRGEGPPDFSAPPPPAQPTRWTGYLTPTASGTYRLGVEGRRNRLFLDDKELVDTMGGVPRTPGVVEVDLEKGRRYALRIESVPFRWAMARLVWMPPQPDAESRAVAAARGADLVVAVVGITSDLEGEELRIDIPGFEGGDRTAIGLPEPELQLLKAVQATGKPLVVVLMSGSALAVNWSNQHANAILEAWYPGEEGGTAIAEVLAGAYNPAGRLPITIYKGVEQLPPFTDYSMANRTYRYFDGQPLFPFGYGLSYSKFAYSNLSLSKATLAAGDPLEVAVDVKNTSDRAGDEVVQLYLTFPKLDGVPRHALRGFSRVHLRAGETRSVKLALADRDLSYVNADGTHMIGAGTYQLSVGGGQPGTSAPAATATFSIKGDRELPR